eukprot:TRINITY_DN2455_c0_g1_i1.p1 TRINITY_DN2455_c0_g1~~TRINITY_DN2455_c0_g1_i1.p1  ORF type:complete len:246 (+),score=45.56 TRINITY_DN2455_c0_g1_i1:62-799(+)
MASPCCPTEIGPVTSTYAATGATVKVGDVDVYVVGSGDRAIITVYDIFGLHPNAYQAADKLASSGFRVYLPDFFRGKPWPLEPWPPADGFGGLMEWVGQHGSYEVIRPTLAAVAGLARSEGAKHVGAVGYCWGAKPVFRFGAEAGAIDAAATSHPSFLNAEDATKILVPTCVLPSKDESPLEDVKAILDAKPHHALNVWQRFDDMHHGWVAARGDWSDPEQAKRATEALNIFAHFFHKVFAAGSH